jgi:DNA excision repair protein ERCC-6
VVNPEEDETNEVVEQEEEEDSKSKKTDTYILKKLMNGEEGLKGIIRHDLLIEKPAQEQIIIENEANKAAKQAVEALKKSRSQIERSDIGVPTWTGRSGSAGAPEKKRFGTKTSSIVASSPTSTSIAPISTNNYFSSEVGGISPAKATIASGPVSSSSLIATIQKQRNLDPTASGPIIRTTEDTEREQLLKDLRDYLFACGGKASSGSVVDTFRPRLKKGTNDAAIFRNMLKSIANFNKTSRQWILKDEFK